MSSVTGVPDTATLRWPAAAARPQAGSARGEAEAAAAVCGARHRWELVRALGAVADSPQAARAASGPLGLQQPGDAEHTDVFVMNLPAYAAVYTGPDGALGGQGGDRIAGFWRAAGLDVPAEPDHLSALLGLYASLGEAVSTARSPAAVAALSRIQAALLWEHLRPWLPSYLSAVTDLPAPALASWARLLRRVLAAETARQPALAALPLALRQAPPEATAGTGMKDLTALLTVPVRSGMILTRRRLAIGAGSASVGHRIGERRFTLRAMLEQDPQATLAWLAAEAFRWQRRHNRASSGDQLASWWAQRARHTRHVLHQRAAATARLPVTTPLG